MDNLTSSVNDDNNETMNVQHSAFTGFMENVVEPDTSLIQGSNVIGAASTNGLVDSATSNMFANEEEMLVATTKPNDSDIEVQVQLETVLGGVSIPALPPNSSTAMQVQVAAAAAAEAAAPKACNKKEETYYHKGRSILTPAERMKQNRDRNREHARSTRLRKKAYVSKLQELVEGLHEERSKEVRRRRVAIQQLAEVQKVRRSVIKDFLKLHCCFSNDYSKWNRLLEEDCWMKQPVTPYRYFRRVEISEDCRISRGIEAMISDSASMSVMIESIGSRSPIWMHLKRTDFLYCCENILEDNELVKCTDSSSSSSEKVKPLTCLSGNYNRLESAPVTSLPVFVDIGKNSKVTLSQNTNLIPAIESKNTQIGGYYHINEDDMVLTDDVFMCPFNFRSQNAVHCGACAECIMPGMIRAQFSTNNKLKSLEMVYDSMGFMQQLERASDSAGMAQIVPNSLEMALSSYNCHEARVITLSKPPFLIVTINELWTNLTKYTQVEVEGKELSILDGPRTLKHAGRRKGKPIHELAEVSKGRCACSLNFLYDKKRDEFVSFISSYPLTNADDEITHLLHIYKNLPAQKIVPEF